MNIVPTPLRTTARLDGGPRGLPAEVMSTHDGRPGKLKVPYCGGYEHFEDTGADDAAGQAIYLWTMRTAVAE